MIKYLAYILIISVIVTFIPITISIYYPPSSQTYPIGRSIEKDLAIATLDQDGNPVLIYISRGFSATILDTEPMGGYKYYIDIRIMDNINNKKIIERYERYLIALPKQTLLKYSGVMEWSKVQQFLIMIHKTKYIDLSKNNKIDYGKARSIASQKELRIAVILILKKNTKLSDLLMYGRFNYNLSNVISNGIKHNFTANALLNDILSRLINFYVYMVSSITPDIHVWIRMSTVLLIAFILIGVDYYRDPSEYTWLRRLIKRIKRSKSNSISPPS